MSRNSRPNANRKKKDSFQFDAARIKKAIGYRAWERYQFIVPVQIVTRKKKQSNSRQYSRNNGFHKIISAHKAFAQTSMPLPQKMSKKNKLN